MINSVTILGNLGGAPESRTFGDTAFASLSIAVSTSYKDKAGQWQNKVAWVRASCWGPVATKATTLAKGDSVIVQGSLESREWTDKEGSKRTSLEVRVDRIIPVQVRKAGEGGGRGNTRTAPDYAPDYPDDEIPF